MSRAGSVLGTTTVTTSGQDFNAPRGSKGSAAIPDVEYGRNYLLEDRKIKTHWFGGGSDLTLRRCVVGPQTSGSYPIFQCRDSTAASRIKRVTIEDCDYTGIDPGDHTEGLWFSGVDGFAFSRLRFWANAVFNIAFYAYPMGDASGVTAGVVNDCWFGDGPRNGGRVYVGNAHGVTFNRCHFRSAPVVTNTFGGVTTATNIRFIDCVWGQAPVMNAGITSTAGSRVGAVSSTPPRFDSAGRII